MNVRNGGDVSHTYAKTNSVKQGCVLASTLFPIFLLAMLGKGFRDMWDRVYIQSRQNAELVTVTQFRAKTKKPTKIHVRELLFDDDSTLIAHSAEEIQK